MVDPTLTAAVVRDIGIIENSTDRNIHCKDLVGRSTNVNMGNGNRDSSARSSSNKRSKIRHRVMTIYEHMAISKIGHKPPA